MYLDWAAVSKGAQKNIKPNCTDRSHRQEDDFLQLQNLHSEFSSSVKKRLTSPMYASPLPIVVVVAAPTVEVEVMVVIAAMAPAMASRGILGKSPSQFNPHRI